ncbi:hypothetical protein MFIFM68171_02279 [Madurella fahalii]|uniref:Uncharacterized protein n=1 Tax=Madurella fahalii TaxID=1157608 RepID=A0ABQ0G2Y0_9PEZI
MRPPGIYISVITSATQINIIQPGSGIVLAELKRILEEKPASRFAELAQALVPFTATNEWAQHPQFLKHWKGDATLEVAIGTGAGQEKSGFSISPDGFAKECRDSGFSPAFLGKLVGKRSLFEHLVGFDPSGERPTTLELGMSTASLRDAEAPLSVDHFVEWLERNKAALKWDPLLIANSVLSFYQHRSYSYVNWRKDLYGMESRLGITEQAAVFKQNGYQAVSFDYDKLNVDLAWLSRREAETSLAVSTMVQQANALFRLAELLDREEKSGKPSMTTEEIQSTILRAELFLKNAAMVDGLVESMRAVLYNRITKHDSNSMKTIAVLTLFFLPSTFVSSVFSTGVFNFHASEGDQPQTISRWAWVYLLVCLLLTAVTLLLWLVWYLWGSLWLKKLHLTRAHSSNNMTRTLNGKGVAGLADAPKALEEGEGDKSKREASNV